MSGRPKEDVAARRRQIVDGALRVFATKGFAQATNREIAAAAGIRSPALIYHYFADKADLLRAVVETHAPPLQLLSHEQELAALPPAQALTEVGRAYVGLLREETLTSVVRLLMGEALRDTQFAQVLGEIGPFRVLRFLTTYLDRQMAAGTLRPMDPALAADLFFGPLVFRLLKRVVLRWEGPSGADDETLVTRCVETFLRGMQPDA